MILEISLESASSSEWSNLSPLKNFLEKQGKVFISLILQDDVYDRNETFWIEEGRLEWQIDVGGQ